LKSLSELGSRKIQKLLGRTFILTQISFADWSGMFNFKSGYVVGLLFFLFIHKLHASETSIHLKCLWASYQNFKISADNRDVLFPNNVSLPYESRQPVGQPIDPHNLTSIDQMFILPYPVGFVHGPNGSLTYPIADKKDELEAGRYGLLYLNLYGLNAAAVQKDLVSVRWVDGGVISFNRRYGAADALKNVVTQLKLLIATNPTYKKYLYQPLGGTFEWRYIAHEKNLSMHSFGIAIDINTTYSNYWLWETGADGVLHYKNRIPPIIAEIFEKNGFVWGGKWYHYDTMHFEYRPELLMNPADCERIFSKYRD
jgi:hypothetical protein